MILLFNVIDDNYPMMNYNDAKSGLKVMGELYTKPHIYSSQNIQYPNTHQQYTDIRHQFPIDRQYIRIKTVSTTSKKTINEPYIQREIELNNSSVRKMNVNY